MDDVGDAEGDLVGDMDGETVGEMDGRSVGDSVGDIVGALVQPEHVALHILTNLSSLHSPMFTACTHVSASAVSLKSGSLVKSEQGVGDAVGLPEGPCVGNIVGGCVHPEHVT